MQARLDALNEEKVRNDVDLYTVLVLKHGQLEVQYNNISFDPNFHDAVLIHRSVVEDLNATTKEAWTGEDRAYEEESWVH